MSIMMMSMRHSLRWCRPISSGSYVLTAPVSQVIRHLLLGKHHSIHAIDKTHPCRIFPKRQISGSAMKTAYPVTALTCASQIRPTTRSLYLKPFTRNGDNRLFCRHFLHNKQLYYRRHLSEESISCCKELTLKNLEQFLDRYDTFFIDCDGTLWRTDHVTPIPGIAEAVSLFRRLGKKLLFVTNNSIHDRDMYAEKFPRFGFESDVGDIFGAAYAAAIYLKDIAKIDGSVYVVGSRGMEKELNVLEIDNFGVGPDLDEPTWDPDILLNMELRDDVKAVLVGFDEYLNYLKIFKASSYLTDEKCLYVATSNVERGILLKEKRFQPVVSTMVASISTPSNREPILVGKPSRRLFDCILEKHPDIDVTRTVMIGDSLKADIGFAKAIGINSLFVLTGAGTLSAARENKFLTPTYFMESLGIFSQKRP